MGRSVVGLIPYSEGGESNDEFKSLVEIGAKVAENGVRDPVDLDGNHLCLVIDMESSCPVEIRV